MNTNAKNRISVPLVMLIVLLCLSLFVNLIQLGRSLSKSEGFRMPEGNPVAGEQAFAEL
jgi:hypothetical protein